MRRILCFVLSILLLIQITACQTYSSISLGLKFEESAMAKKEDAMVKVSDQVFKGDIVGMVLLNVSGSKKRQWKELGGLGVEIKTQKEYC